MLTDADRIESIAQLVGADSLPEPERLSLRIARLLREAVLQQSAVQENDQYTTPAKQRAMLELVLGVHERMRVLLERGTPIARLDAFDLLPVLRARYDTPADGAADVERIARELMAALEALGGPP